MKASEAATARVPKGRMISLTLNKPRSFFAMFISVLELVLRGDASGAKASAASGAESKNREQNFMVVYV